MFSSLGQGLLLVFSVNTLKYFYSYAAGKKHNGQWQREFLYHFSWHRMLLRDFVTLTCSIQCWHWIWRTPIKTRHPELKQKRNLLFVGNLTLFLISLSYSVKISELKLNNLDDFNISVVFRSRKHCLLLRCVLLNLLFLKLASRFWIIHIIFGRGVA